MALKDLVILLVEDDPVFRRIVASFLDSRGATVLEADDGEQGLDRFKQYAIDIVLADLSMPIMGGLVMLKKMSEINSSVPSIVISGNQVMADVVEALRIGASDYLVKPVADLFLIENAIKQCLDEGHMKDVQLEDIEELSYQELQDNLALLEQNAEAAKSVQQQLFPPSQINYPTARIDYSLFKTDEVSAYFIDTVNVGDKHLVMYMAHFHPQDNRAAFGSVLLKSFVNQKLKLFRDGSTLAIIEPYNMLCYLNERMNKSGLDIFIDIVYIVVELTQYRASIAQAGHGLRCYIRNSEGLMPLALPDSLQLGILDWGQPSSQFRTLMPGEKLCISSSAPEHKQMLLADHFSGLTYDIQMPPGGYVQLSF
ncbi:response regulator [Shewanella sp. D64]|uniref:response regulator n=1 Tax=unclassified Shewanella TaxID=196818 RepID=UPI0022BA3175|nr:MULTISPECIES: response regulator [unclassified Shewanella]MEC4726481.1 response regulator [Shewanella sp. D64]MEC4737478.1 response regulator [Shewanella sp. E94]WBJ97290.1 response regulator [Shewanella sp. MTB7]